MTKHFAIPIAPRKSATDLEAVAMLLSLVPDYKVKVANAIARTIRVIHGIELLHRDHEARHLDVYLGRAGGSPRHVLARWRTHAKKRGHRFGMVVFVCDTSRVAQLEAVAVRALGRLKKSGRLCVGQANVAGDGRGPLPRLRKSAIYLTWGFGNDDSEFQKPTIDVIREVADAVVREVSDDSISAGQLLKGLKALKRRKVCEKLEWYLY